MINFEGVATAVLIATYNTCQEALGGTAVAKFSDRQTAEKRTTMALSQLKPEKRPAPFTGEPDTEMKGDAKAKDAPHPAIKAVTNVPVEGQTPPKPEKPAAAPKPVPAPVVVLQAVASNNPTKDAEMPALRRAARLIVLKPKSKAYARKAGTKQSILVDMLSRADGATFGELYDALAAGGGKPWQGVTIRSGLAWDMNNVSGYGVTSDAHSGEEFAKMGRTYEANRLGFGTPGYNPEIKLLVYRLTYPKGLDAPIPHTPRATKPVKASKAAAV